MKLFTAGLAFGLLVSGTATAQQAGDWVLARWQNGPYWFPGVIESRTASTISVAYDDGTRETLPTNLIRPYDWRVGSRVQCRWKGGTEWYSGAITTLSNDGVTIGVLYDDGDRETTRTGACRAQ